MTVQRAILGLANTAFLLTSVSLGWAAQSQFIVAPQIAAGHFPTSIALADFNGDGQPDIARLELDTGDVIVNLNNGNGTLKAAKHFPSGVVSPTVVAAVDVNRDHKLDLVIFNDPVDGSNATASVLLGNGDGTFRSPKTVTLGSFPSTVAFADFNGDGHLDMVAANVGSQDPLAPSSLLLLPGNGDGTFQPAQKIFPDSVPLWVAVGDFNNDGKADLVVANASPQGVSVLLGNGNGTFQSAKNFRGVGAPVFVAAREMDQDHNLDLVVATSKNSVAVLRGNGDGTFQPAQNFPVGISPGFLVIEDFNGDGKLDVAAISLGAAPVSVLLGNGNGTLRRASLYDAGQAVASLAAGDLNGDGKPDLLTANSANPGSLTFLEGKGDGTFLAARDFPTFASPTTGVAGDFNGDGKPDLVFVSNFPNKLSVLLGNGDSTFRQARTTPEAAANSIVAGDLNRDGKLDLVVTNLDDNSVDVRLGNGDGTFQAPQRYSVSSVPVALALGDFNHDGNLDILVGTSGQNGDLELLLGKGDGTFNTVTRIPFMAATQVVVGDFNGDGNLDFIVAQAPFANLTLFRGKGDGTFALPMNLQPSGGGFMLVADLNHDGKLDLVVGVQGGSQFNQFGMNVMLGKGNGTFQNAVFTPLPLRNPPFFAADDFNGDGNLDVVASSFADSNVVLLLGDGKGGFGMPASFPIAATPGGLVIGDFNLDHAPDLAVGVAGQAGVAGTGSVTVLQNTGNH